MAQTIKIKRSTTTAVPSSLQQGELAYSANGNKLFIGRPGGTVGDIDVIGGKYYTDIVDGATSTNTASTLVLRDASGNFSAGTITANLIGNASSADVWSTSRTFTFTGDVAGSFSTNGSADVSNISLTIQPNSVALGTDTTGNYIATLADAGNTNLVVTNSGTESAAVTLDLTTTGVVANTYGSGTAIPSISVDAYGRITNVTLNAISTDLSIAADTGTDTISSGETFTVSGGNLLTSSLVAASGTIVVDHDSVTRADTTSTAAPAPLGTFTAVDSVTTSAEGHVTAVNVKTITMPADTTYDLAAVDTAGVISIDLTGSNTTTDSIGFAGDAHIGITSTGATNVTISHKDVTRSDTTAAGQAPAFGGTFTAVTGITSDAKGHVTAAETTTFTLPTESDTLTSVTNRGNVTTNDITTGGYNVVTATVNTFSVDGSGNITTAGYLRGPENFIIDPAAHGDNTGTVVIAGNLTVEGTTTTINSNVVSVGDSVILLNGDETAAPTQDAGIEVERGTSANVSLIWNETTDMWQLTVNGTDYSNILTAANFEAQIPTLDGGTF